MLLPIFGCNIKPTFLCLLLLLLDDNVKVVFVMLLNLLDVVLFFLVVCGLVVVLLDLTVEVNDFDELNLEENFIEGDILLDDFPEVKVTTDFEELLLKLEVEIMVV